MNNDFCREQLYLEHSGWDTLKKRAKEAADKYIPEAKKHAKGVYDEAVNVAQKGIEKAAKSSIWDKSSAQYAAWKKDYNHDYYQKNKDYWHQYYERMKSGATSLAKRAGEEAKKAYDKYSPKVRSEVERLRNTDTGRQVEKYAREAYNTAKPYLQDLSKAANAAYGASKGDLSKAAGNIQSAAGKAYSAASSSLSDMYNRFMGSSAGAEAKKAYNTAQNVLKNALNDLTDLHSAGADDAAKLGQDILKKLRSAF